MCIRCSAPEQRYIIQDVKTGWLFCEQCGFCLQEPAQPGAQLSCHIWQVNPEWPVFHSFEELIGHVIQGNAVKLPPCRMIGRIPSRIFSYVLDLMSGDPPAVKDG